MTGESHHTTSAGKPDGLTQVRRPIANAVFLNVLVGLVGVLIYDLFTISDVGMFELALSPSCAYAAGMTYYGVSPQYGWGREFIPIVPAAVSVLLNGMWFIWHALRPLVFLTCAPPIIFGTVMIVGDLVYRCAWQFILH